MSMSTHVIGFRPPDERWEAMKHIWDACKVAGVAPPEEVYDFFEGVEPDDRGVEVQLKGSVAKPWRDEMAEGFEVDVRLLPPDVRFIRFYNSW